MNYALIFTCLLVFGCAGLPFQRATVFFEDPIGRLGIEEIEPDGWELGGVDLHLGIPDGGVEKSEEKNIVFTQIEKGEGLKTEFTRYRTDSYRKGFQEGSFILRSLSRFEGLKGEVTEEVEMTARGEIVRLIEGYHDSKMGKFRITDWKRTPVFPEGRAKMGDEWTYQEEMQIEFESGWVKRQTREPYVIRAKSKLTGFALVSGRRCAVIETEAFQTQLEKIKVLWKELNLEIYSDIREWMYLDYRTGTVIARIVRSENRTTSPDASIMDFGQSLSVYSLTE